MSIRTWIRYACLVSAVAFSSAGFAQEKREQLNLLLERLNSPDQTVRVAAFEAAVSGTDRVARELALRTAMSSTDTSLRSLALKSVVSGLKTINVQLALPASVEEALQTAKGDPAKIPNPLFRGTAEQYMHWGGALPFTLKEFDAATGAFTCQILRTEGDDEAKSAFPGQVSGTTVELTGIAHQATGYAASCTVRLQMKDGGTLAGTANCHATGGRPAIMPMAASAKVL